MPAEPPDDPRPGARGAQAGKPPHPAPSAGAAAPERPSVPGQAAERARILSDIWTPPARPLAPGAWLWWFWIFFIHDERTKETGRCRQIMILWSIKNDPDIQCNDLPIRVPRSLEADGEGRWKLEGAAAAWYFDGERMREPWVLCRTGMTLDKAGQRLDAPSPESGTPTAFYVEGEEYVTEIRAPDGEFVLRAKQADFHPFIGPTHGRTTMGPWEVEGTRLERLELTGHERPEGGARRSVRGTAYFQKILLAAPPPLWYWGVYHFKDGSVATYMQVYLDHNEMAANLWGWPNLGEAHLKIKEDLFIYHAPTGRVFEGNRLHVKPSVIEEGTTGGRGGRGAEGAGAGRAAPDTACYRHEFVGGSDKFRAVGVAEGYAHACWTFVKGIGPLPVKSTFKYNEYPAVLKRLEVVPAEGEPFVLEDGWGNMENTWGFLI